MDGLETDFVIADGVVVPECPLSREVAGYDGSVPDLKIR
jgi:hypothetical protein